MFERLPDLLALRIAATDFEFGQASGQTWAIATEGDRQTRLRNHVERRAQVCEQWLPLWRALNDYKGNSKELQDWVNFMCKAIVARIEAMYVPELLTLADKPRRQTVLAIEALVDFESRARMCEFYGLSFEEGCAVWIRAIDRLLPPTPADS